MLKIFIFLDYLFRLVFIEKMFDLIYKIWRVSEADNGQYDHILVISYGSGQNTLSVFSKSCMEILKKYLPHKSVILSIFSKKNQKYEEMLKKDYLKCYENTPQIIYATSSIDECKEAIGKMKPKDKVLIICEGCHSRRLRLVWRKLNEKKLKLTFLSTNDGNFLWDKNNPMITQRSRNVWLIINMALYIIFRTLGVRFFSKINPSQPV